MLPDNKNLRSNASSGSSGREASTGFDRMGISIPELRAAFKGQVIVPDDAGYDAARSIFYGGIDRHPAVIIRVADAADVSRVVSLARESGLELAVRSGGHSPAGHSVTEGGIVLDLSDMRALDIDVKGRTAWAEAGLNASEYTNAADAFGLATGFGDTGSVGIGGITLSGGVGYLVRKQGLTIDSLLAADVVTADGQLLPRRSRRPILICSGRSVAEVGILAWRHASISGCTRWIRSVGGMLVLPATPEVIAGFIAEAEAAPEELSTIASVMPAPPMPFLPAESHGKLVVLAMLVYVGQVEAGGRALAPFRALAAPLADMLHPMRYPQVYPPEDSNYHPTAIGHTMFLDTIDGDVAETIFDYLQASDATMRVAQLRVLGGAMARVPVEATAFAHRRSRIMVNLAAFYNGPEDQAVREAWVADFAAAIQQGDSGAYVGFLGDEGEGAGARGVPGSDLGPAGSH